MFHTGRTALLYCSCGAAQARQWNIPNPSQPNPVREEMGHPVCICPPPDPFTHTTCTATLLSPLFISRHYSRVHCLSLSLSGSVDKTLSASFYLQLLPRPASAGGSISFRAFSSSMHLTALLYRSSYASPRHTNTPSYTHISLKLSPLVRCSFHPNRFYRT